MTAFFGVHLVLTIVSLILGTIIGVFGICALSRRGRAGSDDVTPARQLASSRPE